MNTFFKTHFEGYEHNSFVTSDSVAISVYHHAGSGTPLIMIPGWTGAAVDFSYNVQALAEEHEVYLLESRGHGGSQTPSKGYRLSRLAMDVHEFLMSLGVDRAHLMGHSMGCSVLWSYIDLFGTGMIEKLILGDEPPMLLANPEDTEDEVQAYGGQRIDLWQFINAFVKRGWPEGNAAFARYFRTGLYTEPTLPLQEAFTQASQENKADHDSRFLGMLLMDHLTQDWRNVIPTIDVPTLYMSGENSFATTRACAQWVVQAIPNCQWVRFSEEEGGTHSFFVNCPGKANQMILSFLRQ